MSTLWWTGDWTISAPLTSFFFFRLTWNSFSPAISKCLTLLTAESRVTISPAKEVFYCLFISEPCPLSPCILSRYTHTLWTQWSLPQVGFFSLQTNNASGIDCSNDSCCAVKYRHSSFGNIFMAVVVSQYYLCAAFKSEVLLLASCCDFFFCILTIMNGIFSLLLYQINVIMQIHTIISQLPLSKW